MKNGRKSLPISVIPSKNTNSRMVARIFGKIRSFFSEKFHEKFLATQIFALLIILGTFGVFFSLYASNANRNRPFTFQGQLFTNENLPVADNTPIPIKFAIYSVVSGNANISCLWGTGTSASSVNNCPSTNSYTADAQFKSLSVTPVRGIFTVEMGDTSLTNMPAIPLDFQTGDYFLQVVVNGEALSPRTRITATPYAFNTQEVAGFAISGDISGTPTLSGSYLSFGTGIFTDSSTANGGTVTNMAFHSFLQKTLSATNTSITTSNAYSLYLEGAPLRGLNETITNAIALGVNATSTTSGAGTGVTNSYGLYVSAQTRATNNYAATFLGGSIGIGTATPSYMLDIATNSVGVLGVMRLQNSATAQMGNGAQLLFAANRTTSGMTNVAGIAGIITGIPDGAYRGALALYTASSTEPVERMRIDYLGNVGIGTTAPITQLHVPGKVPSAALNGAGTSTGAGPLRVFVQGSYAYVVNSVANNFQIFDISNPSSVPAALSTTATDANPRAIIVKGRYAYVMNFDGNTIQIFDVSNPSSVPAAIGSVATPPTPSSLFIQGRYAYTTSQFTSALQIFDISNPRKPVSTGSLLTTQIPISVYVQGKYAYLTKSSGGMDPATNKLQIIDISDPANPTNLSSVDTGQVPNNVFVQGRYAYVTNDTGATGSKRLEIFDISNPASPTSVGTYLMNGAGDTPMGVVVQGRYAYVANFGTARVIQILDVSAPSSPTSVGTIPTALDPAYPFVQGRFLYLPSYSDAVFQIFDLGGGYIQQIEMGGLEAASMDVRTNLNVNNGLSVSGGINVGSGGIYSTGSLAISTSHANAIQIAPYGTGAGNTGELRFSELSANGNNYVGLKAPDSITANTIWTLPNADATSTGQVLKTNGSGTLSWTTISASSATWSAVSGGIYYSAGKIGVGSATTPTALLTLTGGGIMMDGVSQINERNSSIPLANTTTVVDASGGYGSITIGPDGLPTIAYQTSFGQDLKVVRCGNAACSSGNTTATVDSTNNTGDIPSIAIGTDGYPVIAYWITSDNLLVAKCGNAACSSGNTITTIQSPGGTSASITIGVDGFPVISYYAGSSDLLVAKCGNAACSSGNTITTIDSTGTVGQGSSITIGIDGYPIISYYDGSNGDLKVAKCGNAACSSGNTITTAYSTGWVASNANPITIGIDGFPIIAFYDDAPNSDLKVIKCGNAACSSGNTTATVDSTGDVGKFASIALGSDGYPVIAYTDTTNGDLKVAKCGNAACSSGNTILTLDSTDTTGWYTSTSIGSDGLPIILYQYYTDYDLKTVHCGSERCIPYWTRR